MLSARTIYGEIFDHDEAFGLFCSIAAGGEAAAGHGEVIGAMLRASALAETAGYYYGLGALHRHPLVLAWLWLRWPARR